MAWMLIGPFPFFVSLGLGEGAGRARKIIAKTELRGTLCFAFSFPYPFFPPSTPSSSSFFLYSTSITPPPPTAPASNSPPTPPTLFASSHPSRVCVWFEWKKKRYVDEERQKKASGSEKSMEGGGKLAGFSRGCPFFHPSLHFYIMFYSLSGPSWMNGSRIDVDERKGRGVSKMKDKKDEKRGNQCPFRSSTVLFLPREARTKIGEKGSDYHLDRR